MAFSIDYGILLLVQLCIWGLAILAVATLADAQEALEPFLERLLGGDGEIDLPLVFGVVLALVMLLDLALQILWFALFEALNRGRSPGKAMMKLQVVREGGLPITPREALVRNLLRAADLLPMSYFVGFVAMVLSPRGQRLGDLAAGTVVVRHDRPAPAPPEPQGETRLRLERAQAERLGGPELRLVRQTLRRLDELPPQEAAAALARTVEAVCRRIGHPPVPVEEGREFLRALLRTAGE
jgi:uncharacterized RDD family membrane protein YckC